MHRKMFLNPRYGVAGMVAMPAVLLLVNAKSELVGTKKLGAFEELLTMPAPVNVRVLAEVRVKE